MLVRSAHKGKRINAISTDANGVLYSAGGDLCIRGWDARTGSRVFAHVFEAEPYCCEVLGEAGRLLVSVMSCVCSTQRIAQVFPAFYSLCCADTPL